MTLIDIKRELRFALKQKQVVVLLFIASLLSVFAVVTGLSEIEKQQQTIERLKQHDERDRQDALAKHSDYGSIAYYSFHLTYLPPSPLAFAAMGQRDTLPWKHRIRMLALEGQIYENDADNPELAFVGRFDFAFLMAALVPLFVIILLHDLRASERTGGRHDLLITTAQKQSSLWLCRAVVMVGLLAVAVVLPFVVGALYSGASIASVISTVVLCVALMVFWSVLSFYVARQDVSGPKVASILLGVWLVTTVVIPSVTEHTSNALIEGPSGGDIVLAQREAVNDAWDLPFEQTFTPFLERHPQWTDFTEMKAQFDWKWYYAFQQVGDQKAEPLSLAYRQVTEQKDNLASLAAWASPAMLFQRGLTRLAKTDLQSAMAYEAQIRQFHGELRAFYYPYLFQFTEYEQSVLQGRPEFVPLK